jgi:WD40 repeat protein
MNNNYIRIAAILLLFASATFGFAQDSTEPVFPALETISVDNVNVLGLLTAISLENSLENSVFEIAFDSTSKLLGYVTLNEIGLWDKDTQSILWRIPAHQGTNVAFSPDSSLMVASNYPETYLWRQPSGGDSWEELYRSNTGGPGDVGDIQFSEDSQEIIVVIKQNYGIYRWQAGTGNLEFEIFEEAADERTMVKDALLSLDGHTAAIFGHSRNAIEFVETNKGDLLSTIALDQYFSERTTAPLSANLLTFSPDNEQVLAAVSASDLPNSSLLFLNPEGEIAKEIQYDYKVLWTSAAFSPDAKLLVLTNAADGAIYFFDAATNNQLAKIESGQGGIISLVFSPDGMLLASGSMDGTVRLWGVPADS